ncbi:hypothetical protein HWV62_1697 [Athelia sp. TMB]|nr:hypothetical protein HWV62_1697 [Athelia sp. TMB]
MQSILQYRASRQQVQRQFERELSRQPTPAAVPDSSASSTTRFAPPDDINNADDVEKAAPKAKTSSEELAQDIALGAPLVGITVIDDLTHGPIFVVGFAGLDDPLDPHNWSRAYRLWATVLIGAIAFIVGWASSIDSGALGQAAVGLHVGQEAETLATGIYLVGIGVGSLFAGPFSETFGRNLVYLVTMMLYMLFVMASGLAPNFGAQIAFRFLAGFFGSAPFTCAGGSLADMWTPTERGYVFPIFANAGFLGPILGPLVGAWIGQSHLSWRWVEWITLIFSGLVLSLVLLTQRETYAPLLLRWKAAHLREITGDARYKSALELRGDTLLQRLARALWRPFMLTVQEPIIMLVALYLTVVYIVLFTFLDGYTFVFTETYGFSQGLTGTAFLGIGIGLCGVTATVPLIHKWYTDARVAQEAQGNYGHLPPEERLWFAMIGAPALPISLFWMGWTAYPSISPFAPLGASVLFGYAILCIFISCYQYLIDAYEVWAASALGSVTLIRYVVAGGMVEVAIPMYARLGVHWTLTLLGGLSCLLVPVPYVFYKAGARIRSRSEYARDKGK